MSTTLDHDPIDVDDARGRATAGVVLDRAWAGRAAVLLLVAAGWNVWVWATRAYNLLTDERAFSVGFVVVHLVLFATSLVLAAVTARIGWRLRAATRTGGSEA